MNTWIFSCFHFHFVDFFVLKRNFSLLELYVFIIKPEVETSDKNDELCNMS